MKGTADPLATLQPIHHPDPVSWWPPAPGWWVVTLCAAGLIIVLIRYYQHRVCRRAAIRSLESLEKQDLSEIYFVRELNVLLKRYALVCYPHSGVESLTGLFWLKFLQEKSGGYAQDFFKKYGKLLSEDLYRDTLQTDGDEMRRFVRYWIEHNLPEHKQRQWQASFSLYLSNFFGRKKL